MKLFLAGIESRLSIQKALFGLTDMKVYLVGEAPWREKGLYDETITKYHPYILESFLCVNNDTEKLLPYYGDFLLDSGAFTFLQSNRQGVDWDAYIRQYAAFIVRNDIQKYFELDIDTIVGYDKVIEYRKQLEKLTGRQCIPVWHRSRGMAEYIRHCDEYPYVAIGGIAIKEIQRKEYPIFRKLIDIAHAKDVKVHGLGFTQINEIPKYHFDSVDSTAWLAGNRFGFLYQFDGKYMRRYSKPNYRITRYKEAALHNYCEWLKFQQYADKHL